MSLQESENENLNDKNEDLYNRLIHKEGFWKWNDDLPYYYNYLKKRMCHGFNPVLVIVGKPRMGKTWIGIDIALQLDPDFNPALSYYISLKDFVMDLNRLNGQILIIDDPGTKLSTFNWSSVWNKAFSFILQTQGYKNNCFIVIVPHIKYVIKAHRYMVDLIGEVFSRGCCKFDIIKTNWAELRINKEMYKINVETVIGFKRPPLKILKKCVEKEIPGKREIMEEIKQMVEQSKRRESDEEFDTKEFFENLKRTRESVK